MYIQYVCALIRRSIWQYGELIRFKCSVLQVDISRGGRSVFTYLLSMSICSKEVVNSFLRGKKTQDQSYYICITIREARERVLRAMQCVLFSMFYSLRPDRQICISKVL